jgi:hypothetical protein
LRSRDKAACSSPPAVLVAGIGRPRRPPDPQGQALHLTQFNYTALLAEDERGFVADHHLQQGNPADASPAGRRGPAGAGRHRPRAWHGRR